jgi:F-type H+-transporting ATPase subunit alpha
MSRNHKSGEVGLVVKAKRYLLTLEGLPSARVNDLLVDQHGRRAIVRALGDAHVFALALGDSAEPGDRYQYLPDEHHYAVGPHLFGRIINVLGQPIDNKGSFPPNNVTFALDVEAPGIEVRQPIHEQLVTGLTMVDTLIPIAKGQRQLVFGPMRGGKSTFLTETVQAQAAEGVICIYAVIGKPINGLRKVSDVIINKALPGSKNIVISALSDEPPSMIALAPSVAFLIAEYFARQGEHVLVILDDLDSHAKYLREIALLEGRLPSTESYPGDIFYQHAHLMERSGHFTEAIGGGSITALPVIQNDLQNMSDLIPTNVMACTDGHLSFVASLRAEGVYPSISIEQSVTRVGRQAQRTLQKQVTRHVQMLLGAYRRQLEYAKFSADLNDHAKEVLRQGGIIESLLQQPAYEGGRSREVQVAMLGLVFSGFFAVETPASVMQVRTKLITALATMPELAPVRTMALNDAATWESFLSTLKQYHAVLQTYVSNS